MSHTLSVYAVDAEAVALCVTLPFVALFVKRHAVLASPFGATWSFVGVMLVAVQSACVKSSERVSMFWYLPIPP